MAVELRAGVNVQGLEADTLRRFNAMAQEFTQVTGRPVRVNSAYRSAQQQAALRAANPSKAAPAGRSMHEYGYAIDVEPADADALERHGLLRKHGFWRPLMQAHVKVKESWHLERVGLNYAAVRKAAGAGLLLVLGGIFLWYMMRRGA